MNLLTGDVVELYLADGMPMAKVRIDGAFVRVSTMLVPEVTIGNRLLIESGVAVSIIKDNNVKEN
jgi:hydrogenase maturation factor